ncbi:MAG: YkgJ family cysteine cluster protein [Desulfobacterales bacterium]|nr:YkgJ family cysteine cluster protein [Desulfobacterales bacterium]
MDISEKVPGIEPVRLTEDSTFSFECKNELSCFTKCCRGINIILTPYDIIRMKNRLQLSSEEFLAIYTEPQLLEKTDLPVVTLKKMDDERNSCPFVKDEGCIIYEDRPTSCRYYPIGVASLSYKDDEDGNEFYFFVNEPHCDGVSEKKEWTIREWKKNQGIDVHSDIIESWADLVVRKRSFPPNVKLTEKSKNMFFMVSYNIDKFHQFIFESSFLTVYKVDEKTIETIKNDEVELMKFGFKWLKFVFFKQGEFELNQEAVNKRTKK